MKKALIYVSILVLGFYLLPFVFLLVGRSNIEHLTFKIIAEKLTIDCENDSSKVIQLYNFVVNKMDYPDNQHDPKDISVYDLLIYKYAFCDQQANVLMSLARFKNIDGRIVFLYGIDSVSHHSVCELKVEGKYRMFGAYFNQMFYNKDSTLASVRDIQQNKIIKREVILPKRFNLSSDDYFDLYDKKYPYRIFKYNDVHPTFRENIGYIILDSWHHVFGELGVIPYLNFYYMYENIPILKQNRLNELLLCKS